MFSSLSLRSFSRATLAAVLVSTAAGCSSDQKKADERPAAASSASNAAPSAIEEAKAKVLDTKSKAPPAATVVTAQSVECSHGDDIRKLNLEPKGSGCVLSYTKNGKSASIATSANGGEHCEKTSQKVRSKLETSGYVCK